MILALQMFTLALLIATLLPLWRNPHWMVRGFDFPRAQFAVLAGILFLANLLYLNFEQMLDYLLLAACLLCFLWQLWWIVPYTPLWPKEVRNATEQDNNLNLSIITANVLAPNRNAKALIDLVKSYQPDILVTLESDEWWQSQLAQLETEMPHTVKCPLDNLYGMHVYSRLPLHDAQIKFLVEAQVPSIHALVELSNAVKVRMHFMHPAPPSPTENEESRERDAELILLAKSTQDSNNPIVVTGDLNDVAWSPTTRLFRKISGLLDPRVGRGFFNTFHANIPFVRWPLDHLFHSKHFTLQAIKRLPKIGSDHFALYTSLTYSPQNGTDQQGLSADSEDKDWANKITSEKNLQTEDVPLSKT
jgi:endonuclease/exonuclease/phosphatase (EEP) superfamily protein YafD